MRVRGGLRVDAGVGAGLANLEIYTDDTIMQ